MITVTLSVYALGKRLGPGAAVAEVHRQIAAPGDDSLPCVRVINYLRELDEIGLRIDSGGTHLGKVRSRHFHEALTQAQKTQAHWVSIDDDVSCDRATVEGLMQAIASSLGACTAPCLVRGSHGQRIDAVFVDGGIIRVFGQHRAQPVISGGMGLFAMHSDAVAHTAEMNQRLRYTDDDGVSRLAVFADMLNAEQWLGEDIAFYKRIPGRIEGLLTSCTVHAGQSLNMRAEGWRANVG